MNDWTLECICLQNIWMICSLDIISLGHVRTTRYPAHLKTDCESSLLQPIFMVIVWQQPLVAIIFIEAAKQVKHVMEEDRVIVGARRARRPLFVFSVDPEVS